MEDLKIGVVAEGISDYWVIKHLVERLLKDKGAYTVSLQPKITSAGKQDGYGGWKNVFRYIGYKEYIIDLARNEGCDYVIVQLDTDVCEEYGVNKSTNHDILFNCVCTKINETIHPDFNTSRIIPAICIHSLECWLIPFVSDDMMKCSRVDSCINVINNEIRPEGTIDKNNKGAALFLYSFILAKKKKPKEIQEISKFNLGFSKFVEQLIKVKNSSE